MNTNKKEIKILLLENIHPIATQMLKDRGYKVSEQSGALDEESLLEVAKEFSVLGIRSKTNLTKNFIEKAPSLLAIGTFCIGTNQVDTSFAKKSGVPVFNAPYSNTRSVAEMVIAQMISLSRNLGDRNMQAHQGKWNKGAKGCHEVRGKTLGIVGYGHIGSQVSVLAEAMGLKVIYYDILKKLPMGNSRSIDSLEELLKISDFVSLHVPATKETRNLISQKQLDLMKEGSYLINLSRGSVVDIPALVEKIKNQKIAGVAVDVFPEEPENNDDAFESKLQGLPNVILSPHIGGSTEEAQEAIGREVSDSLIQFIEDGNTMGAVNFPQVATPAHKSLKRLLNVHKNVPGVLKNINKIVADTNVNISAQYLSTDPDIGYLVMDVEHSDMQETFEKVSKLPTSIKTRLV